MATENQINLKPKERDALSMDPAAYMKKYKVNKASLYSKRYNVNKKLEKAGVKAEDVMKNGTLSESAPTKGRRRGRKPGTARRQQQPAASASASSENTLLSFAGYSLIVNGDIKRLAISHVDKSMQIDV